MSRRTKAKRAKQAQEKAKIEKYLANKRAAQDAAQATQAATAEAQKQAAAAEAPAKAATAEASAAAKASAAAAAAAAEAAAEAAAAETAAAAKTGQWLTTKQTLKLAQISRTTMHLKTKAGTFPAAIKIGKKCIWIRSEIEQWRNGKS